MTRFFICIYIIPNNSSLFPVAVLSNASYCGEGDNYIRNLARKLMGKCYFWDYGIYVRIIHYHCLKWPHSSLPIGLLILFTHPLAGLSPHSSSERWQGPCEQCVSAVQISVSDTKYRCCKKCGCEFRQNFPDKPVLCKWVRTFQATHFSKIN
jgi:hypothetical protein